MKNQDAIRISDLGLQKMLQAEGVQQINEKNYYILYRWNNITYIGSSNPETKLNENQVLIHLSKSQIEMISNLINNDDLDSENTLPTIIPPANIKQSDLKHFKTLFLLEIEENTLNLVKTTNLRSEDSKPSLSSLVASPFRAVLDTKKPFHGHYSKLENLEDFFSSINVDTKDLNLSIVPVLKDKFVHSLLVGVFYDETNYKESLETLKDLKSTFTSIKSLTAIAA